jgi:ATP-binding cassette, subfamily B, bacterial
MYQATSGSILINNVNINDLSAESLHANMGVLFQDFNTYSYLNVRDNIMLGKPDAPIDENAIQAAAENADAVEYINNLSQGFDNLLSERYKGGIKLSTGQWQKLAIARFFYRNAPLLIFDEPTASIDAMSEYNIFNRIYSFFKDKTVILISHRFSTVRNADRILVLNHGKIVEEGTHEELMKLGGEYTRSFTLQAEGYKTETIESIS